MCPMNLALQKYPLPEEEQRALFGTAMASEGLILAGSALVAMALSALQGGLGHALPTGWLEDIAAALHVHWTIVVLPFALIVLMECTDQLGMRFSASYRRAVAETRQGITGELPRMTTARVVACMVAAGFCEELLFRYGLLGLVLLGLEAVLPHVGAVVLAVAAVSLAFWAVHVQYRSAWTAGLVIVMSCVLCSAYLATGSLLTVMVAHAAYNIANICFERRRMIREYDYFAGRIPIEEVTKLAC